MWETYWEERKDLPYYQTVKKFLEELGPQESILDIGCGGCPVSTWGDFKERFAINLEPYPFIKGVNNLVIDWMNVHCEDISVITCLQVIEHFEDDYLRKFVDKIFNSTKTAIISVPYKWPKGQCDYHPQDPIDENKFIKMVGVKPIKVELAYNRLVGLFKN